MPIVYNGMHSIEIVTTDDGTVYNTWIDWHLVPVSKPFIARPEANFNIVAIPGSNRFVDLTDLQPGGLTFGQQTGEWEFYIDHDRWSSWADALEEITALIHGKRVRVRLVDDWQKAYYGRLQVSNYKANDDYSTITISYTFQNGYEDALDPIDDPTEDPWSGGGGGGGGTDPVDPTPVDPDPEPTTDPWEDIDFSSYGTLLTEKTVNPANSNIVQISDYNGSTYYRFGAFTNLTISTNSITGSKIRIYTIIDHSRYRLAIKHNKNGDPFYPDFTVTSSITKNTIYTETFDALSSGNSIVDYQMCLAVSNSSYALDENVRYRIYYKFTD